MGVTSSNKALRVTLQLGMRAHGISLLGSVIRLKSTVSDIFSLNPLNRFLFHI